MIRTFALAAVFQLVVAVAASTAQTVIVTKATPGFPIELRLNGTKIATGVADADGIASLDVNLPAHGGRSQTDVHISVEVCTAAVRVQLVEAGLESPAPGDDCAHTNITGTYVMKHETTFVVDMSQSSPTVWLTQGPPPKTWLHPELVVETEGRTWAPLPKGLVISGGGGLATFGNAMTFACGTLSCTGRDTRGALQGAATMWLTRNFGVGVSFMKPADVVTTGGDTGYSFSSTLQTRLLALTARAGITAGPARIYGFGGEAYHWAIANTTQTVATTTIVVNGVNTTVNGGTQTSGIEAPAWDWLAGGGVEFWVKGPVGIYVEGGYAPLKAADKRGGEARIDDHVMYYVGGVSVHIGR